MTLAPDYLQHLEQVFIKNSDRDTAVQMKRYMKNRYDFYGIKSPLRKEIYREQKLQFGLIPSNSKEDIVKWCWIAPQREWQYFAMEFLGKEARKADQVIAGLYEYMIVNKSWWDTIDFIASNLVGPLFMKHPELINELTQKWMESGNMWLQRSCILFQLKYKGNTDVELLESFILPLIGSKEFFIRKAIGWALREYSKTDPDYVKAFADTHPLSGLSHREALKWMDAKGLI